MDENKNEEEPLPIRLEDLGISVPTYLEQEAIYMHEIFSSLAMAGFTESQALRLTAMIATDGQPSQGYVTISTEEDTVFEFSSDDEDEDDEDYDEDEEL